MSLYDATQQQRYIERQIRRWKREASAMDAAGLDSGAARLKIRDWQARQRDFVSQTGLTRDYFRERGGAQLGSLASINTKRMLTRATGNITQNPMDSVKYSRMKSGMARNGVTIEKASSAEIKMLDGLNAEARYCDNKITHRGDVPSASAMFEEIIHWQQEKEYGILNYTDFEELYAREVLANRKLLQYGKAYGFDEADFDETRKALAVWERKLLQAQRR